MDRVAQTSSNGESNWYDNKTPKQFHSHKPLPAPNTRLLTCYYVWDDHESQRTLDANLCTHVMIINGLTLNGHNGSLIHPTIDINEIKQFVATAKSVNPQLKMMVTLTPNNRDMTAMVRHKPHRIRLFLDNKQHNNDNICKQCSAILIRCNTGRVRYRLGVPCLVRGRGTE